MFLEISMILIAGWTVQIAMFSIWLFIFVEIIIISKAGWTVQLAMFSV